MLAASSNLLLQLSLWSDADKALLRQLSPRSWFPDEGELLEQLHDVAEAPSITDQSTIPSSVVEALEPLQVIAEYRQRHSVEALKANPHNRTYTIAYYSCPQQAGNRMFHFFNAIVWSMVTNRTVLWKYYDEETCEALGGQSKSCQGGGPFVCEQANREEDCEAILRRNRWMPSYDEWAEKLDLPPPEQLHFWTTRPKKTAWYHTPDCPWQDGFEEYQGADAMAHKTVVHFPRMVSADTYLHSAVSRRELLTTERAHKIAERLHVYGTGFLHGALFREMFEPIHPSFEQTRGDVSSTNTTYSIAVHSRHTNPKASGIKPSHEMRCLKKLTLHHVKDRECRVYVMSDRRGTVDRLSEWATEHNCTAVVAAHTEGSGTRDEHGPWAGLGFYQDMFSVARARSAMISSESTSSQLVLALMAYDRRVEAVLASQNADDLPDMQRCQMPMK